VIPRHRPVRKVAAIGWPFHIGWKQNPLRRFCIVRMFGRKTGIHCLLKML